jgi:hypothetical protein
MADEARRRYEEMYSGTTILLPVETFGAKSRYLKSFKQEILDFGMDRKSFQDSIVKIRWKGSRAEEGALRKVDIILWSSHLWKCVDGFEARMEMVIEKERGK